MASRPKGYGLTAETKQKIDGKYDPELEEEARNWIEAVLGEQVFGGETGQKAVQEKLKDGVVLCKLMNAIKPGSVRKINETKMAFKQMENISNYLASSEAIGVSKMDLFQTVDLFEGQNMPQVISAIHALGRKAQLIYSGPVLGRAESTANKREFTEEQLRAGEGVIGLQAGSNKGASQAGQSFGKTRHIID